MDDHSRPAYTEILPDERKASAAVFWARAPACHRPHDFTAALRDTATVHKRGLGSAIGALPSPAVRDLPGQYT